MQSQIPPSINSGQMKYQYCGQSGLRLPSISLGLWHNFYQEANKENMEKIISTAFNHGITYFDLANTYGIPHGSAEENFGQILDHELIGHRDELVISTKAGYPMWSGPYGDGGSRKYLVSSCEQSLKRLKVDYVDIFYHHRPDPHTPLEETLGALKQIVVSGKALYAGISNYPAPLATEAAEIAKKLQFPLIVNQVRYSILEQPEDVDFLNAMASAGLGVVCFSPLAQGLLSDRYLKGDVPEGSRASYSRFLTPQSITPDLVEILNNLDRFAQTRGQSLAQMSLSWLLQEKRIVSVLLGVSSVYQLEQDLEVLSTPTDFSIPELQAIQDIVNSLRAH